MSNQLTKAVDISPEAVLKMRNYHALNARHDTAEMLEALRARVSQLESALFVAGLGIVEGVIVNLEASARRMQRALDERDSDDPFIRDGAL